MNKHILKVKNLRKIKLKLSSYKKKKDNQKPYRQSLNCNIVNFATLNFRASHSKLFSYLAVQLERLEKSLKFLLKLVNISFKKQTL